MKKSSVHTGIKAIAMLFFALFVTAVVPQGRAAAADLYIKGNYSKISDDVINEINKIRRKAGVATVKRSTALEQIARVRAAEALITVSHERLNGGRPLGVKYGGISASGENLSWGDSSITAGINLFKKSKAHYEILTNPDFRYVGVGFFYSADAGTKWKSCLALEFHTEKGSLGSGALPAYSNYYQKLEVSNNYITMSGYRIGGNTQIRANSSSQLVTYGFVNLRSPLNTSVKNVKLYNLTGVTYSSSNSSIATVTNQGVVKGIKAGTATIRAYSGGVLRASVNVTVLPSLAGSSSSSAAAKASAAAVSSAVSSGSSGTYPTGGTYAVTYPAAVQTGVVKTVLSKTDYTYSGKAKKPKVTVYYNGAKLAKKYYSVKYYSNKKPGIATVVITGKGSYKGKFNCTRTFLIRPAKVKIKTPVAGKGYLKVKWKKRPGCSGYEISVADNRNFYNARTVRINASSVKVTSLVRGRKYYCRVRAYKVVQNKALYGSWSKIKVKKVK